METKHTPILLLGMKQDDEIILDDCIDTAQQFASKENLFHLQIDIHIQIQVQVHIHAHVQSMY